MGATYSKPSLDRAIAKLFDTGLFSTVNYQYQSGAGGPVVILQIAEEPADAPVELDIPGQNTEDLWRQLAANDGLIGRQMPNNDHSGAYYLKAIGIALGQLHRAQEIVMRTEADIGTRKTWVVFRPAHLPKIASMRFQGNAAITDQKLQAAMERVAMGQEFTERDFRRMLELNLRPLYEELGHLTVAFQKVSMAEAGGDTVTVTAAIEEGPAWNLGKVELAGDRLPLAEMHDAAKFDHGAPANWARFKASIHDMEQVLRRDGYIRVASNPVRLFREAEKIVDEGGGPQGTAVSFRPTRYHWPR